MSRGGLGRNDPCPCRSGKKYKKCCYPRTFPDFSKPNAGIPDPFEEREASYRALSRQEAQPQDDNVTIDSVDVGRTRLLCAPLAPYGGELGLPGTLAPPTPLQVEAKYEEIRAGNPDGVTEVVVTYTYPEMFGFAEAKMVFDADEAFELADGRPVAVLDLFRGMSARMADGSVGTILGNPQRRYDIPVPPLPDENGLWSSRVVGRVKHTAHEIVEFRWAGEMVRVTPGHAVWSQSRCGWVGAHELFRGEMIRVAGNVVAPVEAARRVPGLIEVFGIEVEYFHNYFVGRGPNAMLVHNGPECVVRPREASGKKAGAGRAGLSEDPKFAAGYEAIFGKKGGAGVAPEIPGVGKAAVTPPGFGMKKGVAGKHAALMIDGEVYAHHMHIAAQELAGKRFVDGRDLYGIVELDANGKVIWAQWTK